MSVSLCHVPGTAQKQRNLRALRRASTRERLYRAALSEFERRGVGAAQVSDIARNAGVAYGTFYAHFENKSAVLLETSRRTAARVRETIAATPAESYATAETFFVDVARSHAGSQTDAPTLRADVWQAAVAQPQDFESHPHIAALASRVAVLQQRGVIRNDESSLSIAGVFLTSLIGFLAQASQPDHARLELLARLYAAGCEASHGRRERP
jgi:TetR/AcrR family transcriptional repressor of uid operon